MISGFAAHLWQSTLFAGVAWFLTLALRKNAARVRYSIWFIASVKFLIPFSLLVGLGELVPRRDAAPRAETGWVAVAEQVRPLVTIPAVEAKIAHTAAGENRAYFALAAFVLWFCGFSAIGICWAARWKRIRELRSRATPMRIRKGIESAVPIMFVPGLAEPGVFGILRPILLLPEGIGARLNEAQLEAILAHELCHVRRRDNLTATIHMAVQAALWFHPLVWWLGARLVDERERACDEEVLRLGNRPHVYAEGILKVCRYYLESPLACASGITGADLKKRIGSIMAGRTGCRLTLSTKLLLTATAFLAVAGPFLSGVINTSQLHAQSQTTSISQPVFEVASVRRSNPAAGQAGADGLSAMIPVGIDTEPGRLTARNETLKNLISAAYGVKEYQISGPEWLRSERYDIVAKAAQPVGEIQLMQMLQPLLAERFKLTLHRDKKELNVYALAVDKNGPKITKSRDEGDSNINMGRGRFTAQRTSLSQFANLLSLQTDRPVVDRTGLVGNFDITLTWAPNAATAMPPAGGEDTGRDNASDPTIFTAVREQLGLKLQAAKERLEVLAGHRSRREGSDRKLASTSRAI